jgi:hypothetical protein
MTMVAAMPPIRRILAALLLSVAAGPASAGNDVVLVELFTSQGCASCPPADRTLARLAERDDVLALSLHVDYWDYLGWEDSFAQAEHTARQAEYRDKMGGRVLFTPQVIVDGLLSVAGYKQTAIENAIDKAARAGHPASITIGRADGMLNAEIRGQPDSGPSTIWVASYDCEETVDVDRGENAGRRFTYHNVVEKLMKVGPWHAPAPVTLPLPQPGPGEGVAVWLQDDRSGRILATSFVEE